MEYSQKYCLVHFVAPLAVGIEFPMTSWPLHVTLADVFAIDLETTAIDAQLKELLAFQATVVTTALQDTSLGVTPVVLLEKSPDLLGLHELVVDLLESNGAVFNTPAFTRKGFLPHSTIQPTGRLYAGDTVAINSVALVDMFPNNDWQQRKILAVCKLQARQP